MIGLPARFRVKLRGIVTVGSIVALLVSSAWADQPPGVGAAKPTVDPGNAKRLIDLPPIDETGGEDRWAVVVGISKYQHSDLNLRYGSDDARAVAQALEARCGFAHDHIKLLTDEQATATNIRTALGGWLAQAAGRGDLAVIYYSGHGAPDIDKSVAEDGVRKYLVPYDVDPSNLFATAVPMDDLSSALLRLRSERTIVLLDCCYSGSASAAGAPQMRSFRRAGVNVAGKLNASFLDTLARSGRGRAVLTACDANESCFEYSDLGHGAFTYFLLEGLNGKAADPLTGNVTVNNLYQYIYGGLEALGVQRQKQTPNLVTSVAGVLTLAGPSTSQPADGARTGILNVTSSPLGAKIFVDNNPQAGATPQAITLPRGAHQVTIYKAGYLPISDEVYVSSVRPTLQSYVLNVEETKGDVLLLTSPGARVKVDRQDAGTAAAEVMRLAALPAGNHTVRVEADGFSPVEQNLTVQAGRLSVVRIELKKTLVWLRNPVAADIPAGLNVAGNGTYRWAKDGAAMVFVSEGPFKMGTEDIDGARPEHEVNVPAFWIDRCEVTNAQFGRFVQESGYRPLGGWNPAPDYPNHPAANVTLADARAYATWAGKRIPSEAQWEKAARGVDGRRYPYEGAFNPLVQNMRMYGFKAPLDVATLEAGASPYGAMDMLGNVWEWCDSPYVAYPGNAAPDVNMNERNYIIRGGSYLTPALRSDVSVAARSFLLPNLGQEDVGFRCVVAVP